MYLIALGEIDVYVIDRFSVCNKCVSTVLLREKSEKEHYYKIYVSQSCGVHKTYNFLTAY
jgi:hypothetical protein